MPVLEPCEIRGRAFDAVEPEDVLILAFGELPLRSFARQTGLDLSDDRLATIADDVRTAAYRVRELKGATWHAIGLSVGVLVRCMVREPGRIIPVSVRIDERMCASLPWVLGPDGAGPPLWPPMDAEETAGWEQSLAVLRGATATLS